MNTLTLHQPWASLVAVGAKSIETRPWRAPANMIGQRLIVHAGKTCGPVLAAGVAALNAAGWQENPSCREAAGPGALRPLPLGVVVASCVLADCVPIIGIGDPEPEDKRFVCALPRDTLIVGTEVGLASRRDDQLPFGDFSPGRFAWLLEDVKPTTERCPACWGEGTREVEHEHPDGDISYIDEPCFVCLGAKVCDPVPAKGKQGLWEWTPERVEVSP